jgi:hypothetical protein
MSGLDTSQLITDYASEHAKEQHLASRPHKDISGKSPLIGDEATSPADEATSPADEATSPAADEAAPPGDDKSE